VDQPLRWKARWWSEHSRLYDVRARQWSPEIGSFTSIDAFAMHDQRATLWAWPRMNPLGFSDPSGWGPDPGYYQDNDDPLTPDFYMSHGDQVAGVLGFEVAAVVAVAINPFAEGSIAAAVFEGAALGGTDAGIQQSLRPAGCFDALSIVKGAARGGAEAAIFAAVLKGVLAVLDAAANPGTVNPRSLRPTEPLGSRSQAARMAKLMRKNGYVGFDPIEAVDIDGQLYIIDGHHRASAASQAGLREIPVNVREPMSSAEADELLRGWAETLRDRF
jgi:RHS repeat-associated protein